MRVYEFLVSPYDEIGMSAISLVEKPAMESQFIAFNKQEIKPKYIKFQDESKHIVAGLALIPDKLVYRIDEESEDEYLGFFSAETIELIMQKFMDDAEKGVTKNVNLQHDPSNTIQAHLIESFILRTPQMVDAVKAMGIEDAVLGSWFVSYKFDSAEAYQEAISGGFTGFSIEVMLQRELKLNKNNNKSKKNIMAKVNKLIERFKTMLDEIQIAGNFEDAVTADGTLTLRWNDVNTPVLSVVVDEAGVETEVPVAQGEYILADNRVLVVDANGRLTEIREATTEGQAEVNPINPNEFADMPPMEEDVVIPPTPGVESKTIGDIVDITKDGEYYINVVVSGGQITEATVEGEQNLVKAEAFNIQKSTIDDLNAEIVNLKAQLAKPIVKPAYTEFTTPGIQILSKEEKKKMNNLELTKHKLGLK
jgi:hypothetical protein